MKDIPLRTRRPGLLYREVLKPIRNRKDSNISTGNGIGKRKHSNASDLSFSKHKESQKANKKTKVQETEEDQDDIEEEDKPKKKKISGVVEDKSLQQKYETKAKPSAFEKKPIVNTAAISRKITINYRPKLEKN